RRQRIVDGDQLAGARARLREITGSLQQRRHRTNEVVRAEALGTLNVDEKERAVFLDRPAGGEAVLLDVLFALWDVVAAVRPAVRVEAIFADVSVHAAVQHIGAGTCRRRAHAAARAAEFGGQTV